jgi:hypothetical protein
LADWVASAPICASWDGRTDEPEGGGGVLLFAVAAAPRFNKLASYILTKYATKPAAASGARFFLPLNDNVPISAARRSQPDC